MPEEACEICGKPIKTMAFKNTGTCSRKCQKEAEK